MRPLAPVLRDLLGNGVPTAIVTVAEARGSTPREAGARMLVTAERTHGTIGGGRLEYDAMLEARALLKANGTHALREVPLGPALGQCCGGHATILIERAVALDLPWLVRCDAGTAGVLITRLDSPARKLLIEPSEIPFADVSPEGPLIDPATAAAYAWTHGHAFRFSRDGGASWLVEPIRDDRPRVVLFGAGHVGRALAEALAPLPCRVRWVDQRAELMVAPAPDGVEAFRTDHPLDEARRAPAGAFVLVMTHSHDLDCELCAAFLKRRDFAFLGLIGSATKRARFAKRWRAQGIPADTIERLVCPIGLPGISGKQPEVIAAATAAQLLLAFEQVPNRAPASPRQLADG